LRQASRERGYAVALAGRLRERRGEIEAAISTRVMAMSRPAEANGSEYTEGLRTAIAAGIDYGIAAVEREQAVESPVPAAMRAQAQLAARSRVGLDTVLRRYLAGHALLGDFILGEAAADVSAVELKRVLRRLAAAMDRAISEVTAAYNKEAATGERGAERRRAELVERLLAGQPLDPGPLGYELDPHHLGIVAAGDGTASPLRRLARSLDARLLIVRREQGVLWAWLGRRDPIEVEDVHRLVAATWPPRADLALGETGEGSAGWRLTHHQARAAFLIAKRSPGPLIRYADVAVLASILQDDLLSTSLRRLYLDPLEDERGGGATLRTTLRAYFTCGRNGASTAAALGVSRQTVNYRLQTVEERLGRPLSSSSLELDAILRLTELEGVLPG
jgi:hypothetical protein